MERKGLGRDGERWGRRTMEAAGLAGLGWVGSYGRVCCRSVACARVERGRRVKRRGRERLGWQRMDVQRLATGHPKRCRVPPPPRLERCLQQPELPHTRPVRTIAGVIHSHSANTRKKDAASSASCNSATSILSSLTVFPHSSPRRLHSSPSLSFGKTGDQTT